MPNARIWGTYLPIIGMYVHINMIFLKRKSSTILLLVVVSYLFSKFEVCKNWDLPSFQSLVLAVARWQFKLKFSIFGEHSFSTQKCQIWKTNIWLLCRLPTYKKSCGIFFLKKKHTLVYIHNIELLSLLRWFCKHNFSAVSSFVLTTGVSPGFVVINIRRWLIHFKILLIIFLKIVLD